jgi:c-di-GMP-binding flagellar brake protein YcgR
MNTQTGAERRKFARLDLALTVSYAVIDPAGQPIDPREALSSDISAGGLRLMTPTPLENGATLDLNIFLAEDEERPIRARGEVVWQTKISNTSFETGVVIKGMPDEDKKRFMSFVFDQLSKVVTG